MIRGLFDKDMVRGYPQQRFNGPYRETHTMHTFQSQPEYYSYKAVEFAEKEEFDTQIYGVINGMNTSATYYNN